MSHRSPNESVPVPELAVSIRRTILVLAIIAGALIVLHVITRALFWFLSLPNIIGLVVERFNADNETSVPTYFSALLLLLVAVVAFLLGRTSTSGRRWWFGAAGVALAMSLDEAAAFHETTFQIMQRLLGVTSGPLLFAWIVPALVLVVIVVAVFARFALSLPPETRLHAGVGVLVYLLGAIGVEMLKGSLVYQLVEVGQGSSFTLDLLSGLGEALELAGVILVLRALLLQLQRYALPERSILLQLTD